MLVIAAVNSPSSITRFFTRYRVTPEVAGMALSVGPTTAAA
jgi:hypothetical protein